MPQIPQEVVIVTRDGDPKELHIDGAEFPWAVAADSLNIDISGDDKPDMITRMSLDLFINPNNVHIKEQTND